MSKDNLLVPYGLSLETGRMVHVEEVPHGKNSGAVCPVCKVGLVAKNAGMHKVHHFAHAVIDSEGACEGWLHQAAKLLLHERIQNALVDGQTIPINWQCDCLCGHHEGDLLKRVTNVRVEAVVSDGKIRTDILLENDGREAKLVEIVVTHRPESYVYDYARAKKIPLVVFALQDASGCDHLKSASTLNVEIDDARRCRCEKNCSFCGEKVRSCYHSHRYCEPCGECVEHQEGQFGGYGDHGHCTICGKPLVSVGDLNHGHHFCCWVRQRHDLPPCPEREHRHCKTCGKLTGRRDDGEFWETCYPCHQKP